MDSLRSLLFDTRDRDTASRWQGPLVILTAVLALVIALVASQFPIPLMPGVFGTLALLVAVMAAGLAWSMSIEHSLEHITLWHVAEAFAVIGIIALMFARTDEALQLLGIPV